MELVLNLSIFLGLLAVGYFFGHQAEKKHYLSINAREKEYRVLPVMNLKNPDFLERDVEMAILVTGNMVVAVDYFKVFVAALQNIFGGRVTQYEPLVDRARREATLRMQEEALRHGADLVMNVRLDTSFLGDMHKRNAGVSSIESIAYGTAIRYKPKTLS
jgi:uncharacterized protein YbjQ (UPF0145 family)